MVLIIVTTGESPSLTLRVTFRTRLRSHSHSHFDLLIIGRSLNHTTCGTNAVWPMGQMGLMGHMRLMRLMLSCGALLVNSAEERVSYVVLECVVIAQDSLAWARQSRMVRPPTACSRWFNSSRAVAAVGFTSSRVRAASSNEIGLNCDACTLHCIRQARHINEILWRIQYHSAQNGSRLLGNSRIR